MFMCCRAPEVRRAWRSQGVERPAGRAGHAMALLQTGAGARALAVCCGRTGGDRLCRDTWLLELPACM